MGGSVVHDLVVPAAAAGQRLDVWLESVLEGCTRSLISRLIKQGHCLLENAGGPHAAKSGYALHGGERVSLEIPAAESLSAVAENIPLTIVHEDEHLIVINKPPGMVVHPAVGHAHGTLVNALLGRYGAGLPDPLGEQSVAWRPGIVHRLDEDTSGLIVVARTEQALEFLQNAFKAREVHKRYLALVAGQPRADFFEHAGWIGRHARDFRKRAVYPAGTAEAKEAYTSFIVLERHVSYSAVECRPRTGRTHQIRVHLAARGHAVLADHTYGRSRQWPLDAAPQDLTALHRQALHAWAIDIPHPAGGRRRFVAPIPADLACFVNAGCALRAW